MRTIDLVDNLRPIILAARQFRVDANSLSRFLPPVEVMSVSFRLGRTGRADQTVPVRAFGAPAIPVKKPKIEEVRGDLPAITPRIDFSETDLNNEFILAQQLTGGQVDWTDWVTRSAGQVASIVDNTFEQMRGQALSTGKIQLETEDGETHEVDFGLAPENVITADDPDNILDELLAAHAQFVDSSGEGAGVAVASQKVRAKVIAALAAKYPAQQVGGVALNGWLADNGLPEFFSYDRAIRSEDRTRHRVFPEDTVTFLPVGDTVGRTELGVTQEALQLRDRKILRDGEVPGLTVVTLGQDDPVERSVKGAAVGLPVINDPDDIVIVSGLLGPESEDEYGSGY